MYDAEKLVAQHKIRWNFVLVFLFQVNSKLRLNRNKKSKKRQDLF